MTVMTIKEKVYNSDTLTSLNIKTISRHVSMLYLRS